MAGEAKKVINAPISVFKKLLTVQALFLITVTLVGNIAHAQLKKHWAWYRSVTLGA